MSDFYPCQTQRHVRIIGALLAASLVLAPASATDLSDAPLTKAFSAQVKPNILFILDDSGSMDDDGMPDNLSSQKVGFRNHKCNTIYYNPDTDYVTPKDAGGNAINPSSPTTFTAAYNDGFHSFISGGSNSTTNLSTSFKSNGSDTAQAAHYWTYVGSNTLTPGTGDCTLNSDSLNSSSHTNATGICSDGSKVTSTPPACSSGRTLLWKKVVVSSTSGPTGRADERQNFANWYSYYRTRLNMMKSATGRTFVGLGDAYRVGFITINPNDPVSSSKFLPINDFGSTQKTNWFNKLYSQTTNGWTPLRTALTRAGRYYAHKTDQLNSGMNDDPVQYACQQNFAILTTDGYWNGPNGEESIGGYKLDGITAMDNQDGIFSELDAYNATDKKFPVSPRPIYDGATSNYTWNTLSKQFAYSTCNLTRPQQKQVQWQSREAQLQKRIQQVQTRTGTLQQQQTQLQRRTAPLQKRTSSNSGNTWTGWSDTGSTCTVDSTGTNRTECRYGTFSSWSSSSSCTPASSSGSPYSVTTAVECQTVVTQAWTDVSSCSEDNSGANQTQCRVNWGNWSDTSSCTSDTSGQSRRDCQTTDTGWVAAASCTPSSSNGQTVTCQTVGTGTWTNTTGACVSSATVQCQSVDLSAWAFVASCTPSGPDASGVETLCQTAVDSTGKKIVYKATTTSTTYPGPNQTGTAIGSPAVTRSAWIDVDGVCYASGSEPALPSPNPQTVADAGPPAPPSGCSVWPCETLSSSGGTSNTLADTAQYYYKTDLRTPALGNCTGALGGSTDVCNNIVQRVGSSNEDDLAIWQHMTTFTMGLGLSGTLAFQNDYKTATTGDFMDLRSGAKIWPNPANSDPARLDDLWHAAVNGRGRFFSSDRPDTVVQGLSDAFAGIEATLASGAGAAASTQEPVSGDNFAYIAEYKTKEWVGDVAAHLIDLTSGAVLGTTNWSAQQKLDTLAKDACDNRNIRLFRSGATDNLVDFKWNTKACDSGGAPTGSAVTTLDATEQANFGAAKIALLSQYSLMTDGTSGTTNQRADAAGATLVNFLRGQRGNEGFDPGHTTKFFRTRTHVLGDVVSAQPIYVKGPFAEYDDTGYGAFKSGSANRTPMVYVAANDGMLHAFHASNDSQGGEEAWAFMPTMVLPNLYKLAHSNYANLHTYLLDGTPAVADVYDATAGAWKTILVGGLNKGGKGYYALDITSPTSPKALWEFKWSDTCYNAANSATWSADCHLGYTYGNPVVSKLADGTWAVFVTSGYDNLNSPAQSGDGQGYLYVLNAITGKIIYKIGTGVGDSSTPSNLGKISGWANNPLRNNTVVRLYGGDMLGNVWRFDVNDDFGTAGREATLVTKVVDSSGNGQPITTKPVLAEYSGSPMILFGTGRMLGSTDLSNTQGQSIWAIKDPLTETTISNPRTTLKRISIAATGSGSSAQRTATCAAQCDSTAGWYADLPDTGERINVDVKLELGTLIAASNVPLSDACTVDGYSWLNYFNYGTGTYVVGSTEQRVGHRIAEALAVGLTVWRVSNKVVTTLTYSKPGTTAEYPPTQLTPPSGKRVSWREIIQ